jgi:hypothetical protein
VRPLQIAKDLGLANQTVYNLLGKGRRHGALPPIKRKYSDREMLRRARLKTGKINEVIDGLTREQLVWMVDQCAKMRIENVSEFALELVRDAYEEDTNRTRAEGK